MRNNIKARWATVLVVLLLSLSAFIASTINDRADAAPSSNGTSINSIPGVEDTQDCVTFGEWGRIKIHMTKKQAVDLLDGFGTKAESFGVRWYRACEKSTNRQRIFLHFKHFRVQAAVWLVLDCYPSCHFTNKYRLAA